MNFWKIADVWHELMTETLGHGKYAAAGCDVGALVTGQLGHKYAGELYAIHIGSALKLTFFNGDRAWDLSGGRPIPANLPPAVREQAGGMEQRFAVHLAAHVLDSGTLGYGLADSPVGMLAWILERWTKWSDNGGDVETVFTRDDLLTHATIYWTGNAIDTSIRTYANNNRYPWTPSHDRWPVIEAPTGITFVGYENPPGVTTSERSGCRLPRQRPRGLVSARQRHGSRPRRAFHPVGDPRRVGRRPAPDGPRQALSIAGA